MNLYFRQRPGPGPRNELLFRPFEMLIDERCYFGGSGSDPNAAVLQQTIASLEGSSQDVYNYPKIAIANAQAQMGTGAYAGLGTADQNAKVSDQMAQAALDIQKNYGAAYIKQRLADLQQSDPTGYAARKQLFDSILAGAEAHPDRPMADDLQAQVTSLLGQGSNLTTGPASETEAVQQQVRGQQLANGIFLGNAPTSQEASAVVNAGDQMQQQRQRQALGFLNSGVSPEDVEYRRVQQGLSNLGNAIAGTTPEAQFGSLSGAQHGAAPVYTGGTPATAAFNPNAASAGLQNANAIYSGNVNWANAQANPWTTGISTGINSLSTLASAGTRLFASTPSSYNTGSSFGVPNSEWSAAGFI